MGQDWPLVGRDPELASIVEGLRSGVGAVVVGAAGVGKSALAGEITRALDADGWPTRLVLCSGRFDLPLYAADDLIPPGAPTLLVIDDAHLLDDDSAESVWRVAGSASTRLVVTVRAGETVPERILRLWTGGICRRIDLAPLDEADVRHLLERVLGGDVDDRLPLRLVRRAGGNALLLRELIRAGAESGAIVRSHEVWRLAGELPIGGGIADLVRTTLAALSAPERRSAELLALGEPLPLRVAERLVDGAVLERLEAGKIVAVQETARGAMLTTIHPLYGEVMRADIPPLRLRRQRRELLEALSGETDDAQEFLRAVRWRLELDEQVDGDDLIRAAELARSGGSRTAEALARAALKTQRHVDATILLAEILSLQGRFADARRLLEAGATQQLSPDQRERLAAVRALGLTWLGSETAASGWLADLPPDTGSYELQALATQALMLDGRIAEAHALADRLFADPTTDPMSRLWAIFTLSAVACYGGDIDDTAPLLEASLPLADTARAAFPHGVPTVVVMAAFAETNAGRLDAAEQIARQLYESGLGDDDEWTRPRAASAMGWVALVRGLPRTATRYLRIAVSSLNEFDQVYLRSNMAFLIRGLALGGLVGEAREALCTYADDPLPIIFQTDWDRAEAATLAAEGQLEAAAGAALRSAREAAGRGQWASAMTAAYDSVRYAVAPDAAHIVVAAAERLPGPLPAALSRGAVALQTGDAVRLVETSTELERIGTLVYAAELAYAAARAHRAAGDGRSAVGMLLRASQLHARCEGAVIPWASGFHTEEALTARERQVALLAAGGWSDATIATELGLSVRTVQTHLTRAYAKLAVRGRNQLSDALIRSV